MAPLFSADPILLHLFIGICPREDYLGLFTNIPTYLALTFVSHLSVKVQYVNKDEVNIAMTSNQSNNVLMTGIQYCAVYIYFFRPMNG